MSEQQRVEDLAAWYINAQLDLDKRLIEFRYRTIRQYFLQPLGLELGRAEGEMTRLLCAHFERLTVVEGAAALLDKIPDRENVVKVQAMFEEFEPVERFNTIIMEHILEHVDDPVGLLRRASSWLAPGGALSPASPTRFRFTV